MSLSYEQLQCIWSIHKKLDDLLESLQFEQKELKAALESVFLFIKEKIGVVAFFVETKNEKLINTVFTYGACDENIKLRAPQLSVANRIVSFTTPGVIWFAQPIDVDNHVIGTIAMAFKASPKTNEYNNEFYSTALNTISELLDSYIYSIHCSCIKHSVIMGLQEALADLNISKAIYRSTEILHQMTNFSRMLIVYADKEIIAKNNNTKYMYFDGFQLINDDSDNPLPCLEKFIRSDKNFLAATPQSLCNILNLKNITISYLTKGVDENDRVGFIAIEYRSKDQMSVLAQDLVQIFSEELRQRLVDLNREKNILRKYFSNPITNKLITTDNYETLFLAPREAKIGILFADISGFTKMSEQILKTPERITNFVNKWANGVVARVFPLGATLDKLVGDSLMLLFGPPFYDTDKEIIVKHMLQSAQQIVKFTKKYLKQPENLDIQKHPDFEKFGVTVGLNYSRCIVGLIGPNQDLTAFSSGVNITARLQGIAKTNQILVSERIKNIAEKLNGTWTFSEKQTAQVKNVEKPIGYYELISGRQE